LYSVNIKIDKSLSGVKISYSFKNEALSDTQMMAKKN